MTVLNNKLNQKMIYFLLNEIGLQQPTLDLGIKLSKKNNSPLPILLWSYGMITIEELDMLYSFLFQNME
tara:strand:- start:193 stop:399 length:207 start_codon:yes stop_codon:yes gene_type:complete